MPNDFVKFSVVVPVYNSAAVLAELHQRLTGVMQALGEPYELVFDRPSAAATFPFPAGDGAPGSAGAASPPGGFPFVSAMGRASYPFGEMTDSMCVCRSRVTARGTRIPLIVTKP